MLRALISAIQFLTIIPLGQAQSFNARAALPFFPLCGLIIGGLLSLNDSVASMFWSQPIVSLLDVVVLILISGALHLDGLADATDGLYGERSPEKALAIMKDSRIGAMGMVAVICCLAIKWAGLTSIETHRHLWLLIIPAYARGSVLWAVRSLPYGRLDGIGKALFQKSLQLYEYWGLTLVVILSLMTGWQGFLIVNIGFMILVTGIIVFYRRKIGCITGDMLGAMIEVIEAGLFLIISMGDGL